MAKDKSGIKLFYGNGGSFVHFYVLTCKKLKIEKYFVEILNFKILVIIFYVSLHLLVILLLC